MRSQLGSFQDVFQSRLQREQSGSVRSGSDTPCTGEKPGHAGRDAKFKVAESSLLDWGPGLLTLQGYSTLVTSAAIAPHLPLQNFHSQRKRNRASRRRTNNSEILISSLPHHPPRDSSHIPYTNMSSTTKVESAGSAEVVCIPVTSIRALRQTLTHLFTGGRALRHHFGT